MNIWLWAAAGMLVALVPCGVAGFRGSAEDRLGAVQIAGVIVPLQMVLLAEGFAMPAYLDLPLALTVMSFGGGVVYARFLQRWL